MKLRLSQTSARADGALPVPALSLASRATVACAAAAMAALAGAPAFAAEVDEQYRQALYLRETGQPYAAIESLEALLAASPTLNRARLELAVAYYRTLEFDKARAQAQKVVDDPKTPEAVRLSVLSFIKKIELEQADLFGKPHRFETSVSIGLLHDSNVNAGPENALLPNGLVLTPGSLKQADWGVAAQAGLTHTWGSGSPLRVGNTTARFSWVSQVGLYHKAYSDLNDYDLTVLTLATGPAFQFQSGDRANLNFQLDHLRLGNETLALYSSISPSYTWRLGNGEVTFDGTWSHRSFQRADDRDRTGNYGAASLSYGRLLMAGRLAVQGGATVFKETAADEQFGSNGAELFAGARYRAWEGGDLLLRGSVRRARYDGVANGFDEARRELDKRIELGASHRFGSGTLEQWLLSGTVSYTNNGSNLPIYDYDRLITSITLGRSF